MVAGADAATEQVLGLDVLIERDSDGFMEWIDDFARGYGGEATVADDLDTHISRLTSVWKRSGR